jgi:predicted acylesterase/phospholipase RssA
MTPFPYDVFLSHSSKDKAVVRPLAERLRQDGVKVWFDEWVLKPGDSIPARIEEGLEQSRVLVLCLSNGSIGEDLAHDEAIASRIARRVDQRPDAILLQFDNSPVPPGVAHCPRLVWHANDSERAYAKLIERCSRLRTCDVVMKGGITSGVVYPLAIVQLAQRFVFKNIGGTSAGAIAAAIAAAAEYDRQQNGSLEGFNKLGNLPTLLVERPDDSEQTRLFRFFEPFATTRRFFDILTSFTSGQSKGCVLADAVMRFSGYAIGGALPGLALASISWYWGTGALSILWLGMGLLLSLLGTLVATAVGFFRGLVRVIPNHGFGLCSGMSAATYRGGKDAPAMPLTVWLTGYLNETAGLKPDGDPLTFGHLWRAGHNEANHDDRSVNLEMMTTNLTHRRPYRLPFRDDEDLRENAQFFFREDEMRRYFPEHVVRWMIENPRESKHNDRTNILLSRLKAAGYHPMPAPENLPVVVATRMSLSFPFLLCAVPLHAIDWEHAWKRQKNARGTVVPERCWFSDGGICSNFPLHFFDSALPRRPTFSIDLADVPADTPDSGLRPFMPKSNGADILERWNRFDTEVPKTAGETPVEKPELQRLLGFVWAMIGTMQNWTDTTQGRLPGYRDRIVTVPLKPNEGGLNLNMPPGLIDDLSKRGMEAANLLRERFDVPATEHKMTWDNHRWIRLRSVLAALEKSVGQIVITLDAPDNGDTAYEDWLESIKSPAGVAPSYGMTKAQLRAASETLRQLRVLNEILRATNTGKTSPRPRMVLRPRPQI